MKLWLPRALLLQLLQQTKSKLKINLLMGSRLSKQLLCAKAAFPLAVTTQPGLLPVLRLCVAQAHKGRLVIVASWVGVAARTWSWGCFMQTGLPEGRAEWMWVPVAVQPLRSLCKGKSPPGSELMVQSWFGGPGTGSEVTWL